MKSYLFVLGRDPELSFLETMEYFKARNMHLEVELAEELILIIKSYDFDAKELIKHLGGTQKIGLIIEDLDKISLYEGKSNKIKYGISNYKGETKELQKYLKQRFKDEKLKAYQKKSSKKELFLSPTEAGKVDLELICFEGIIAKTIAVFNPKEYESRDLGRPMVNFSNAISIRLAKFLINLAGVKEKATILNLFCGIGTVMQEGLLNNYNMIGIDFDKNNIDAAKENLKWLKQEYSFNMGYALYKEDVAKISERITKVDAVASELFMGPLLKYLPTAEEAVSLKAPLVKLYSQMLRELNGKVKKRMVLVVPRWRVRDSKKPIKIDFETLCKKNHFKALKKLYSINLPYVCTTGKSRIEREIWIIEPLNKV